MKAACLYANGRPEIPDGEIVALLRQLLAKRPVKKLLVLAPDVTRANSYGGQITQMLYQLLTPLGVQVDVMPAIGSHIPMSEAEMDEMYTGIPHERFLVHHWCTETVRLGEIPAEFCAQVSEGRYKKALPVEINRRIVDGSYDQIVSVGQVVPHEVVGMANYTKNVFVGCGGRGMITASHYIGALYGMERVMGHDHSPLHQLFDYAQEHYLKGVPILYLLTVNRVAEGVIHVQCLAAGDERDTFETAVAESQRLNIQYLEKPLKKVVAYLDEKEFQYMWVANKAVYRTRMAIADGGELLVIAPGVNAVGEDADIDAMIRKYGYCGRDEVCRIVDSGADLADNLSAAAHMIHSSSDGRFSITYAPGGLSREEIESMHFQYMPLAQALKKYPPDWLRPGFNTVDGEEIYYIPNPAVGLWTERARFQKNSL